MRISRILLALAAAWTLAVAGIVTAATTSVVFPEVNGPPNPSGPFPQPPLSIATKTLTIPPGERVVAATISGEWGSSGDPDSTSGVTVYLDGIVVAKCVKPDPQCWTGNVGQRSWTYTFKEDQFPVLNDGEATLSAVQTSDLSIRLGATTLVVETAPPPVVPTLSLTGLAAMLALMAAAGMVAASRLARS